MNCSTCGGSIGESPAVGQRHYSPLDCLDVMRIERNALKIQLSEINKILLGAISDTAKVIRVEGVLAQLKLGASRTNLEQYLAMSMQMLMAREDGRDDSPYLDKLDGIYERLTQDEKDFCNEMGKDWAKK